MVLCCYLVCCCGALIFAERQDRFQRVYRCLVCDLEGQRRGETRMCVGTSCTALIGVLQCRVMVCACLCMHCLPQMPVANCCVCVHLYPAASDGRLKSGCECFCPPVCVGLNGPQRNKQGHSTCATSITMDKSHVKVYPFPLPLSLRNSILADCVPLISFLAWPCCLSVFFYHASCADMPTAGHFMPQFNSHTYAHTFLFSIQGAYSHRTTMCVCVCVCVCLVFPRPSL